MIGRPPTPTAIKLLHGNPGKRPLNKDEPSFSLTIPECPDHIDGVAREQWLKLAPLLVSAGVLTEADHTVFEQLCESWALWMDANQKLKDTGPVLFNKKTQIFQQNPMVSITDRYFKAYLTLAAHFGLTPGSRSRLHVDPKSKDAKNRWAKVGM